MSADALKVDEPIDRAQHMIGWDVTLQAELVKQSFLHHSPFAHHPPVLQLRERLNQDFTPTATPTFSTKSFKSGDIKRNPILHRAPLNRIAKQRRRGWFGRKFDRLRSMPSEQIAKSRSGRSG
jgi:hypothetical protein